MADKQINIKDQLRNLCKKLDGERKLTLSIKQTPDKPHSFIHNQYIIHMNNIYVDVMDRINDIIADENIIGKIYRPSDNSYIKCLETGKIKDVYLAGTAMRGDDPKPCLIISNPYEEAIEFIGKFIKYEFINVLYQDNTYRVLWNEKNVLEGYKAHFTNLGIMITPEIKNIY